MFKANTHGNGTMSLCAYCYSSESFYSLYICFCFSCLTQRENVFLTGFVLLISQILVETGHIGRQASASVMVTDGETVSG